MANVRHIAAALLLGLLAGCSPRPGAPPAPAQASDPASAIEAQPPAPGAGPQASATGRDLEAIHLCELISNAEVAALFGAQPARDDLEGVTGSGCTYQVTPDGGATIHNVFVYLYAEDLAQVSLTLVRDEGGSSVEGMGDEAYMQYESDTEQYRLVALRRGDFGLEISGPGEQGLLSLGQLILDRLPAEG